MKYLKLAIIFVVVAGGLVLALNWSQLFPSGHGTESVFSRADKIDVEQLIQRIENDWIETADYNDTLYINWYNRIEQKKGGKLLSEKSYNTVRNILFENAANKLEESFSKSLKHPYYSDDKVKMLRHGVDTLVKYEEIKSLKTQPKFQHIRDLYDFYSEDLLVFVSSNHRISPVLNKQKLTWKSFKTCQQEEVKIATDFKKNPLYSEMNTIPIFVTGLDEDELRTITNKFESGFYDNLSSQIIKCFDFTVDNKNVDTTDINQMHIVVDGVGSFIYKDKLTEEGLKDLGRIWNQFQEENDDCIGYKELSNYKSKYNKALAAKKKALGIK